MYFARLRSKTDTHIPPIAGQVWIPIVRHIRIMKRLAVILGSLARAIIRDARRGYENREFKHGTRFFRRVYPPPPGLEWYTPCPESAASVGRASTCVSEPTAGPSECDGSQARCDRTRTPGTAAESGPWAGTALATRTCALYKGKRSEWPGV